LENCSSGQQEALPLTLILKALTEINFIGKGSTCYIEEPEAHLFPFAQRDIVNLISLSFNRSVVPSQFILTTHSPYILTAFNNNIHAGELERSLPQEKTSVFV
jgi:predicted ATPase